MRKEQFFFEVCEVGIVQLKLTLQSTIGNTAPNAEHLSRLVNHLREFHTDSCLPVSPAYLLCAGNVRTFPPHFFSSRARAAPLPAGTKRGAQLRKTGASSEFLPGKGAGYPAPSPQIRTCRFPASGSSVATSFRPWLTTQVLPRWRITLLSLTPLDVVEDPGRGQRKLLSQDLRLRAKTSMLGR